MIPIREFRSLVGLDDVHYDNDVRFLDEIEVDDDNNITTTTTTTNSTAPIDGNDAAVLRNTMVVYGGLFCILFVLFCILRQRYPKVYNIRNWVPDLKTTLAEDTRGTFSWLWKVFLVSDSEMLDECGMDALCFARVLEFGLKLSILGMLMAIWLIPVYATGRTTPETAYIEDRIVSISVSHVPSGSYRFCATVVACYCVFGFTMYNILQEFTWFISYRHQYLAKRRPRNYAVYIQCIPPEYRTKAKLMHFLQQSQEKNSILDVHLAVKVPNLKKRVAERDAVITKLEHAITVQQVSGVTPMQRNGGGLPIPTGLPFVPGGGGGAPVSLIDALFEELRALNNEIGGTIEKIEKEQEEELMTLTSKVRITPRHRNFYHHHEQDPLLRPRELRGIHETQSFDGTITTTFSESNHNNVTFSASTNGGLGGLGTENGDERSNGNGTGADNNSLMGSIKSAASKTSQGLAGVAKVSTKGIVDVAKVSTKGVKTFAAGAISLVQGDEDGTPMNAAFVTFKSLRATQATLQMIQYPEPFAMEVLEAPDPDGKKLHLLMS